MPARGVDTLKVPDGLGSPRLEVLGEESPTILQLEYLTLSSVPGLRPRATYASEPPGLVCEGLHVEDLNKERVTDFCLLDRDRTRKIVDLREIYVLNVVCVVVVEDLTACPLVALKAEHLTLTAKHLVNSVQFEYPNVPNGCDSRNGIVPAIEEPGLLLGGFGGVDLENEHGTGPRASSSGDGP